MRTAATSFSWRVTSRKLLLRALAAVITAACCQSGFGQIRDGYYQPMHHNMPPGQAAAWLNSIRRYDPMWMQPIRIELPTEGTISVYSASPAPLGQLTSPAQFSINAGHHYRLRLADMPELPAVEVYPSVELIDHLHPPAGQEHDFPIPVVFSIEDLRLALEGKLVTRVIYLEQPQLANSRDPLRGEFPQTVSPADNALFEADRLGRPIAIVRIGGRIPLGPDVPLSFFGSGGPVDLTPAPSTGVGVARLSASGQQIPSVVRR